MFIPNEISFMYEGKISVLNGEVSSFITCKCRLSGSLPSNVYRTWVFDPRFKIKTGFINNGFSIQFIFKSGHGVKLLYVCFFASSSLFKSWGRLYKKVVKVNYIQEVQKLANLNRVFES